MSPVRYRSSGSASFVGVLNTSSPGTPSGTGARTSGPPPRQEMVLVHVQPVCATTHSAATPGPMISDRP